MECGRAGGAWQSMARVGPAGARRRKRRNEGGRWMRRKVRKWRR